jgi:hypothetical protein
METIKKSKLFAKGNTTEAASAAAFGDGTCCCPRSVDERRNREFALESLNNYKQQGQ